MIFLFLVVNLYRLFKDVDEARAMLMVVVVSVGVAVALENMLNRFAPLILLGGAEYRAAFTRPQLEALAMDSMRLRGSGAPVPTAFWGLRLFPFGLLVIRESLASCSSSREPPTSSARSPQSPSLTSDNSSHGL